MGSPSKIRVADSFWTFKLGHRYVKDYSVVRRKLRTTKLVTRAIRFETGRFARDWRRRYASLVPVRLTFVRIQELSFA